MIDSAVVLNGQTIAYTLYCSAIILLMGWFGFKLSRQGKSNRVLPGLFYSFVSMLVILGVSLHIITFHTIPWVERDLNRANIKADKTFDISMSDHSFHLPAPKLLISAGDQVMFNVSSSDLTYGFGVFRSDQSMMFQMQVVPGHNNDILWKFETPGLYTIRSTEYSGPKGINMIEKDVIEVIPQSHN